MANRSLAESFGTGLQFLRRCQSFLWKLETKFKGAEILGQVQIIGRPIISVAKGSRMTVGDGVTIASSVRANPLACFQPSVLRTLAPEARLVLGKNVGISATVICAGLSIEIGEGTIVGSGSMIIDNDFHSPADKWTWQNEVRKNARGIKIGRGVFVGARAIILKGVTIGDRAIIGAGAVVTKDIPAGGIACGNPARTVRHMDLEGG